MLHYAREMLGRTTAAGGYSDTPDANTLFICRFQVSPPVNEMAGGATGTLVGNASCDTANSQLVLDGTGDWATWASNSVFNPQTNWTIECHCNVAAADGGSMLGRGSGGGDTYVWYLPGDGSLSFYADVGGFSPLFTAASAVNGSDHHFALCRDGGTWRFYKDGVQLQAPANASAPTSAATAFFVGSGGFDTSGRAIAGRIGRVKISNVCRYPSGTTFTPPVRTNG